MTLTDPIRGYSDPDRYWTTANIGEAVPDVMTPLCWSLWGSGNQLGSMRAWASFGLFDPADATVRPDQNDSISGVFYGRPAINIDLVRSWLGRFPGMDADEFELSITGSLRPRRPRTRTAHRRGQGAHRRPHRPRSSHPFPTPQRAHLPVPGLVARRGARRQPAHTAAPTSASRLRPVRRRDPHPQ